MGKKPGKKPKVKLTGMQELFCQFYTTHWNATRAAKEAGYSEKSSMELGYQNLQIPSVKARIAELTEHALKEIGINRERVLQEYSRLAFYDLAEAYDEIGQLKPVKEMPEDIRRAVSKVKVFEVFALGQSDDGQSREKQLTGYTKEVEFAQKKPALDSIAKVLGMAPDRHEHSGPNGKPIETRNIDDLTDDQLDARLKALQAKAKKGGAA